MILIGEKKEDLNIVHLIIGPESDFQLDMYGQAILNISEYCEQHKNNTILIINRCKSEQELAQKLIELKNINDKKSYSGNKPSSITLDTNLIIRNSTR